MAVLVQVLRAALKRRPPTYAAFNAGARSTCTLWAHIKVRLLDLPQVLDARLEVCPERAHPLGASAQSRSCSRRLRAARSACTRTATARRVCWLQHVAAHSAGRIRHQDAWRPAARRRAALSRRRCCLTTGGCLGALGERAPSACGQLAAAALQVVICGSLMHDRRLAAAAGSSSARDRFFIAIPTIARTTARPHAARPPAARPSARLLPAGEVSAGPGAGVQAAVYDRSSAAPSGINPQTPRNWSAVAQHNILARGVQYTHARPAARQLPSSFRDPYGPSAALHTP
jgi:hypothetical protein